MAMRGAIGVVCCQAGLLSRLIFAIVSTINIPLSVLPTHHREEHGPTLPQEGSLLDADHPGNGVLIARRSTSGFDGVAFDPFSFQQDGLTTAEVDIGRRQVVDALQVPEVVVVGDEVVARPGQIGPCGCASRTASPSEPTPRRGTRHPGNRSHGRRSAQSAGSGEVGAGDGRSCICAIEDVEAEFFRQLGEARHAADGVALLVQPR